MELIEINSSINITVTKGLGAVNMTDPNARFENKLNVKQTWTGTCVDLKVGAHVYPACIKDWPTVKKLAEQRTITIGQIVAENAAPANEVEEAKTADASIKASEEVVKKSRKKANKEIAEYSAE